METISEISVFSQNLINFLGEKEVGEVITYESLSEVIGFDVTESKGRGYLGTATKRLLKDEGKVFSCVRSIGVILLSDSEVVKTTSKGYLKSIRAKGRKAYAKSTTVEYESLTPDEKIDWNCTMSILALMNHVTKRRSIREIENKVRDTNLQIDQKETLRILRKPFMNGSE